MNERKFLIGILFSFWILLFIGISSLLKSVFWISLFFVSQMFSLSVGALLIIVQYKIFEVDLNEK